MVSELQVLDCKPDLLKLFPYKAVLQANLAFFPKVVYVCLYVSVDCTTSFFTILFWDTS